jgi:hypothetical protein
MGDRISKRLLGVDRVIPSMKQHCQADILRNFAEEAVDLQGFSNKD